MGFGRKAGKGTEQSAKNEEEFDDNGKVFVRDDTDNKLFTDIQVKDTSKIITDDCVGVYDADTLLWKACANMEKKYIIVRNEAEDIEEKLDNISMFRGLGKKVKETSWLGTHNVDRELKGLEPLTPEDFTIEEGQELKMDHDKAVEQAKIQIFLKLTQVGKQFGIKKFKLVIGEGDNFRHDLDLCRPYKGQRKPTARPIILKEIRAWAASTDKFDLEEAAPRHDGKMVEADDVVEYYGALGYQNYRKTGKFNFVVVASDKDGMGNPKLLINPDTHVGKDNPLKGKFKFAQAMLIHDTSKTAGDLELVPKKNGADVKGYGFKFIMYQALLGGDGADNYNALTHLGQKLDFGDQSAYKALKPCKTAKECLQKAIDVYAELLPYGVQYTTHDGREMDVDTITYMNTYFKVAYMMRSSKDTMDFYRLCAGFKVDTSKIEKNNRYTKPQPVIVSPEKVAENLTNLQEVLRELLKGDLSGFKSKGKAELVERLERTGTAVQGILEGTESYWEMKSELKEQFREESED